MSPSPALWFPWLAHLRGWLASHSVPPQAAEDEGLSNVAKPVLKIPCSMPYYAIWTLCPREDTNQTAHHHVFKHIYCFSRWGKYMKNKKQKHGDLEWWFLWCSKRGTVMSQEWLFWDWEDESSVTGGGGGGATGIVLRALDGQRSVPLKSSDSTGCTEMSSREGADRNVTQEIIERKTAEVRWDVFGVTCQKGLFFSSDVLFKRTGINE